VNPAQKIGVDDYEAKIRFWARNPRIVPLPSGPKIPHFPPQKFNSYAEMNAWKEKLIRQMAAMPRG
jgi:hypothetical protein